MPSKKISEMTVADLADLDLIPFVDVSETNTRNQNKKTQSYRVRKYLKLWTGEAGGTNEYTVTEYGIVLSDNNWYCIRFQNANTAGCTLIFHRIGEAFTAAKSIVKRDGSAIAPGEIAAGSYHVLVYDSANDRFVIQTLKPFHATATKTADYTATVNDDLILVDATAGNIIITLPASASFPGKRYTIKKIDSSVNTVTIDGNSVETIDGAATVTLSAQWDKATVQLDGVNVQKI